MENWIIYDEYEWDLPYELERIDHNFISDYESKKNEEYTVFIKEWLKHEQANRLNLYSESFFKAAYQEIEESPFELCGLNCYIAPWHCLDNFYYSVNSRLSPKDSFNFEENISIEYYNQYDNVSMCYYLGYWSSLELDTPVTLDDPAFKYHLCGLTPYDIEMYYKAIDDSLEKYKGKVNCIKKRKIDILKECIDFRTKALNEIDNPEYGFTSLYENSRDWICLEINAITDKITEIESNAMDVPLYEEDLYIINKLENWIGYILDRDNRYSTERFGMYVKLFLKRAFEKDSWQRYLLRELGAEKSRIYLIAKYNNKKLPFSPIIEKNDSL